MHFWSEAIISRSTEQHTIIHTGIVAMTHNTHTKQRTLSFGHKVGLINEKHQTPASVRCSSHPSSLKKNTATKQSKWLATRETQNKGGTKTRVTTAGKTTSDRFAIKRKVHQTQECGDKVRHVLPCPRKVLGFTVKSLFPTSKLQHVKF